MKKVVRPKPSPKTALMLDALRVVPASGLDITVLFGDGVVMLYIENGALKFKGASGTITTLGVA